MLARPCVLVLVAAAAPAGGAGAGPAGRATTVPNSIAFWDSQHGLLGTSRCRGSIQDARCTGTVQITANGGRTFRTLLRTPHPVGEVEIAGPGAAIAAWGGRSFRTLDGGRSWRPFRQRYQASYATPEIGLGFRSYVTHRHNALAFLATSDGGRTWQHRASPCAQAASAGALIDLVSPTLGWVVCLGEPGAGNQEKAVFRTSDGGRSWRAGASGVLYPHPKIHGGLPTLGYPESVAFASDGFGILLEGRGTMDITHDGGINWHGEPKIARPELDFGRGASALEGGGGVVLLGIGGSPAARLLATADAGRNWRVVHRWR